MNYEEKYKEALDAARYWHSNSEGDIPAVLEEIFPELRESEDDRIRKGIIRNLEYLADRAEGFVKDELKERIAWLEKQGEKNTNPKTMIVKFICKKDWHGIGDYYYGKIYNGYPCKKEQKGYDIYDDNHIPTFYDEDFINEYFNIVTEENQGEQKLAEKVEPKFKISNWIINRTGATIMQIVNNEDFYESVEIGGQRRTDTYNYVERDFRLWSIEDAKDDDVLVHNGFTFIFKGIEDGIVKGLCSELSDSILNFGEPEHDKDYYPATKEQRDTLMKAMADAGYTFDFEKKELKKIKFRLKRVSLKRIKI